jgi:hypothetical protein
MVPIRQIRSDKDTNFTTAVAANAYETENLTGLAGNSVEIRGIAIHSDQRLAWDVAFYSRDTFGASNQDNDMLLGVVTVANAASRIAVLGGDCALKTNPASNTQYVAYVAKTIPYIDIDNTAELHIALINRSGTTKTATTGGEVVVEVFYEPTTYV